MMKFFGSLFFSYSFSVVDVAIDVAEIVATLNQTAADT
jgi:hypothetical protein